MELRHVGVTLSHMTIGRGDSLEVELNRRVAINDKDFFYFYQDKAEAKTVVSCVGILTDLTLDLGTII